MQTRDFNEKLAQGLNDLKDMQVEPLGNELKEFDGGIFHYAAWCEKNFEANLREDYKRKTTFTSDLSIAEWCVGVEGTKAILDTIKRSVTSFRNDIDYFAELIIAVNMKSWEHHACNNYAWSKFYAELYHLVLGLYFDWFDESNKKHDEAMDYYFDYVD